MLAKILENIGLNSKEAKVYLAALEIGSNPVSKIASKAKINRVTAYDIIEKLIKKGLISSFTRARVKFFTATDPEKVIQDFHRKVGELNEALPELQRLSGDTVHPRVRYFEGLDGIRHIYEDTLSSKTEILNYGDSEEIRRHWPTYDTDYVAKRAEKNIFLRGITLDDEYGHKVVSNNTDYNREIRLVSKDLFDFSNEIHIYDDKVAIISFKDELIGMIIESPEIANTQRAIFKIVWEFSKVQHVEENISALTNVTNVAEEPAEETPKETDETPQVEEVTLEKPVTPVTPEPPQESESPIPPPSELPESPAPEIENTAWKQEPDIKAEDQEETTPQEVPTETNQAAEDQPSTDLPGMERDHQSIKPVENTEETADLQTPPENTDAKIFDNREQGQLF